MFSYRTPKGSCWGAAIHPGTTLMALQKMDEFFKTYFEPARIEKLTLNLNPYLDVENHVPKIKEKAVQIFGRSGNPESLDWVLAPEDYRRAVDFILENHPGSKKPSDPIWLSFTCSMHWKDSALPNVEWPEDFLKPESEKFRRCFFIANLRLGGRFMFPLGIGIPVSISDPASYGFLGRFSADTPFKMNPKHFQVVIPVGKNGNLAFRKPDSAVAAQLREVIK